MWELNGKVDNTLCTLQCNQSVYSVSSFSSTFLCLSKVGEKNSAWLTGSSGWIEIKMPKYLLLLWASFLNLIKSDIWLESCIYLFPSPQQAVISMWTQRLYFCKTVAVVGVFVCWVFTYVFTVFVLALSNSEQGTSEWLIGEVVMLLFLASGSQPAVFW